ncbi:hypothetical protein BDV37DRAFT_282957 [Aspergillus pseudonomiae]|uniref:Uncharacterized protein n=1 Tax=Aspergillus pseudonomiae TaxID=1506151 RepID=A0A5N7DDT7_9EURO|nr:uncharacterized protein BDV37DRAFT_282957 [Aspergillus pseudonomiae]KAE8404409.1 hypothetical protein BDV37DRAFT_282957 [Aspergillus pseudonomiae]
MASLKPGTKLTTPYVNGKSYVSLIPLVSSHTPETYWLLWKVSRNNSNNLALVSMYMLMEAPSDVSLDVEVNISAEMYMVADIQQWPEGSSDWGNAQDERLYNSLAVLCLQLLIYQGGYEGFPNAPRIT